MQKCRLGTTECAVAKNDQVGLGTIYSNNVINDQVRIFVLQHTLPLGSVSDTTSLAI